MGHWSGTDLTTIKPLMDVMGQHKHAYSDMGSDYSVTTLLQPPRIVMLKKRYQQELDNIPVTHESIIKDWSSFTGTAIHNYLERCLYWHMSRNPNDDYLIERRLWDRICDRKISGKFDCYINGALFDFKTTSTWKRVFGDTKDWEAQLNVYAYLLRTTVNPPIHVNNLMIMAAYRDWDRKKIFQEDYPKTPVELYTADQVWSPEKQRDFLYARIHQMKINENVPDEELTPCSKEEMWEKDPVYAVMDPKSPAKAKRLKPTEAEAKSYIQWAIENDKPNAQNWTIQFRAGKRLRCEDWCDYNIFCDQWHEYMADKPPAAHL